MPRPFVPSVSPPGAPSPESLVFLVRDGELLVLELGDAAAVPTHAALPELRAEASGMHFLGVLAGVECWAIGADAWPEPPDGHAFHPLRPLHGRLADDQFGIAGRALQIVEWDVTHRFCGRCGAATEPAPGERAKRCPGCGLLSFPRLSPAVIVRVSRGDRILLAHGTRFPASFYSVLAGFVEPGESLEECVAREIEEEVGIEIDDIRYFGSQPWPFPHSLMIGFTAEHRAGELRVDPTEIVDAGWFAADELPLLPPKLSIARTLIDAFVEERSGRPVS